MVKWSDQQLTVAQLRAALDGLSDEMPVTIEYDNENGCDEVLAAYVEVDEEHGDTFVVSSGP